MKPSYGSALVIGAVVGLVVSMVVLLFVGATGAIAKMGIVGEGADIEPAFAVPASAFWTVAIVAGAISGLLIAIVTRALTRVIDPASSSAPSYVVGPIGAIVGGVVAIAVYPVGASILGTISDGVATVTVVQMVGLTAVTGLAIGGAVAWLSYVMARPPQFEEDTELLAA